MSKQRKKLFENKTDYLVLAFVIGVALMLTYCETAEAEWSIEEQHDSTAGISDKNPGLDRICGRYEFETQTAMFVCPLVAIGGDIQSDSWEVGFSDEIFPRWEGLIRLNRVDGFMYGGPGFRRIIGDGPFQMTLGLSYWFTESPGSNSDVTYNLGLRYTL